MAKKAKKIDLSSVAEMSRNNKNKLNMMPAKEESPKEEPMNMAPQPEEPKAEPKSKSDALKQALLPALTTGLGLAFGGLEGGATGAKIGASELQKMTKQKEEAEKEAEKEAKAAESFEKQKELLGMREEQALAREEREAERRRQEGERRFEQQKELASQTQRFKQEQEQRKAKLQPTKLTNAQEVVDREFAKDYTEFVASGGKEDVKKNISQLEEVVGELESGESNLTGAGIGLIPKFVRDIVAPESARVQEAVEEVVQRNLRVVLGAQFTEKEGERLISRAYNPRLSEAENAKRVKRLMKSIKDASDQKLRAAEYYEKNGTLKGFKGAKPGIDDIERTAFGTVEREEEQKVPQEQIQSFATSSGIDPELAREIYLLRRGS